MIGVKIELLVVFAVILLAPIIHTYYLWIYKKVDKKELINKAKIFAILYVMLGLFGVVLTLRWVMADRVFGEIQAIPVGATFLTRKEAAAAGVHKPLQACTELLGWNHINKSMVYIDKHN